MVVVAFEIAQQGCGGSLVHDQNLGSEPGPMPNTIRQA
jgi:hypothetical protein